MSRCNIREIGSRFNLLYKTQHRLCCRTLQPEDLFCEFFVLRDQAYEDAHIFLVIAHSIRD